MKILRIPAGIYAANSYIVYLEDSKEGIIIDPGGDSDYLMDIIKQNNININFILLTHGHGDHIGGVKDLKELLNIPILIHKDDKEMLENAGINLSSNMAMGSIEIKSDRTFTHGDLLEFGNKKIEVIHTPGHTKGSCTFLIEDNAFTGDTLFAGSIGRTDLYGGDFDTIISSIKDRLMILPDNVFVYSGHGPTSTIGKEKRSNPYIK